MDSGRGHGRVTKRARADFWTCTCRANLAMPHVSACRARDAEQFSAIGRENPTTDADTGRSQSAHVRMRIFVGDTFPAQICEGPMYRRVKHAIPSSLESSNVKNGPREVQMASLTACTRSHTQSQLKHTCIWQLCAGPRRSGRTARATKSVC